MSSSNIWLLSWGLIAVIVIVVLTLSTRRVVAIGALIVLIPFQVVETRYASSSVLMAYAMAGLLAIGGGLKLRMMPAIGLIMLAYLISLSQAERYLSMHVIEIFQFGSCLVVFLLAYNYARLVREDKIVINTLLAMNSAIIVYCALQLSAGAGNSFVPFGIDSLAFNSNRDPSDPRLVGPFDNPGTTAGYFTLMTLIAAVELIFSAGSRRLFVQILVVANMAGILATGNRASFLILLAAFPMFIVIFRRELGARRVAQYLVSGVAALAIASTIIITYTGFGNMFRRLDSVTEMEGGVPTTRAGTWPVAIEKIKANPWVGDGPHFFRAEDAETLKIMRAQHEELGEMTTAFDPYPHSMYLFMLRTVGIIGLVALLWFFGQAWRETVMALNRQAANPYRVAVLKIGLVVIVAFLIGQITLEFNRPTTMDYAQFIFALLGLFVGMADRSPPDFKTSRVGASDSDLPAKAHTVASV